MISTDELETGATASVIVNATWKSCAHGGGWWVAKDADGREVLLVPNAFLDADLAAELIAARAKIAAAEGLAEALEGALAMLTVPFGVVHDPDPAIDAANAALTAWEALK